MPDPAAEAARGTPGTTLVLVRLPGVLVDLFPGSVRRVELEAGTVAEMIDGLDARWPGMRDRLCAATSTSSWTASAPGWRRRFRPAPRSSC
jgi:hypothetical protein